MWYLIVIRDQTRCIILPSELRLADSVIERKFIAGGIA